MLEEARVSLLLLLVVVVMAELDAGAMVAVSVTRDGLVTSSDGQAGLLLLLLLLLISGDADLSG